MVENNPYEITLISVPASPSDYKKRCCCNCGHDIRVPCKDNPNMVDHNECEIDGHYIGYLDCFEHWCNRWCKDKKFKDDDKL